VEELLAERGVIVTYETVRQWSRKFGQTYANALRRRRPQPGDTWHLDEVCSGSNGVRHDLWRVVDQAGNVRDSLVPARRRLRKQVEYVPRALVTDTLARYGAARRKVLPRVAHQAPPAAQQPGGERAPADPRAGAADAAVHVARPRPALPRRLRPQRWPLPPQTEVSELSTASQKVGRVGRKVGIEPVRRAFMSGRPSLLGRNCPPGGEDYNGHSGPT